MKKVTKKMSENSLKSVEKACIIFNCEKIPYDINRGHNLHAIGRMFRYPDGRWWPEYKGNLSWCR